IVNDSTNGGDDYFGIADLAVVSPGVCSGGPNDGGACGQLPASPGTCSGPCSTTGETCASDANCAICIGTGWAGISFACTVDAACSNIIAGTTCSTDTCTGAGTCSGYSAGISFRVRAGAPEESLVVDSSGLVETGFGLDVGGDLTVGGTVDGRDVAADGIVLDGLAAASAPDLTAILTDISTLQTAQGVAQGDITSLQTAQGIAQGDITSLQTAQGIAQAVITSLQTAQGIAQGDIISLQTAQGIAQAVITSLQTTQGIAQGDIISLQTAQGIAQGDITSLQSDLVALTSRVDGLDAHVADTSNPHAVTAAQTGGGGGGGGSGSVLAGVVAAGDFVPKRGHPYSGVVTFPTPAPGPYAVLVTTVTAATKRGAAAVVSEKTANGFTILVTRSGFRDLAEVSWMVVLLD
ncbi:MAG: hypothetical protein ABGY42_12530, partial [bacterium]